MKRKVKNWLLIAFAALILLLTLIWPVSLKGAKKSGDCHGSCCKNDEAICICNTEHPGYDYSPGRCGGGN